MHAVTYLLCKGFGHKCRHPIVAPCHIANSSFQHAALITGTHGAVLMIEINLKLGGSKFGNQCVYRQILNFSRVGNGIH